MPDASSALPGLLAFALLFGLKHGFDADHLATIDGLARLHAKHGRGYLARCSGALFSIGHGVVVLAAACLLYRYGIQKLPDWLAPLGTWISIVLLLVIGATNLRDALSRRESVVVTPPVAAWVMRLPLPQGIAGSLLVGALFALSVDTMSVAMWFGLAGSRQGTMSATWWLGMAFAAGMILTDAINGAMVAYLIRRSERFAERARRLFSLLVSACSSPAWGSPDSPPTS